MAVDEEFERAVVAEHLLGLYTRPGFMHPGVSEVPGALHRFPADAPDVARSAVERVVAAYQHARGAPVAAAPSLWDRAADMHAPFIEALASGDVDALVPILGSFFQTSLVWGLARQPADGATEAQYFAASIRTADAVVALGEAVGVQPVGSLEHQGPFHEHYSEGLDCGRLVTEIERTSGVDLSCLDIAANIGWTIGHRITNTDTLVHTCAVLRLRQLRATARRIVAEIGGGYGCMAALAHRAGLARYAIFDLPWVNALQGYVLIRALGHGPVRLYGEKTDGTVAVEPFWEFERLAPGSVDIVVNVNSLPEIGAETARAYVRAIADLHPRFFLSINQEAMSSTVLRERQHRVSDLVAIEAGLQRTSRALWWMEQGYVEEVFRHTASTARLGRLGRWFRPGRRGTPF